MYLLELAMSVRQSVSPSCSAVPRESRVREPKAECELPRDSLCLATLASFRTLQTPGPQGSRLLYTNHYYCG